jgi:hypothetical protein
MLVKIKEEDFIRWYILLFNGWLELTSKEISILEEFIRLKISLETQISNEDLLNNQLFSSVSRQLIREKCNISSEQSFNNHFGALKNKGVIDKTSKGYKISPKILPQKHVVFDVEFI